VGAEVAEDWSAVASAISGRLAELRTTQMDVAAKARISLTTLRELQHNNSPRQRRPQTLSALSEALGWPADYLARVLRGENARPYPDEEQDPVLTSLTAVERELGELRDRVERIERQLAGEDG
jgi:transcriptional regulator with XRE-family HTH domain